MRNSTPGPRPLHIWSLTTTSVESGWRACVHKSGQASTREPADSDLQGEAFMDPALVNGRRVDFHVVAMAGSTGADVMITSGSSAQPQPRPK